MSLRYARAYRETALLAGFVQVDPRHVSPKPHRVYGKVYLVPAGYNRQQHSETESCRTDSFAKELHIVGEAFWIGVVSNM